MKFGNATLTAASPVTPKQFLGAFFSAGDTLCLRIFTDRKDQPFTGMKLRTTLESFDSLQPQLEAHNDKNRGIFFVVNAGGQADQEITRINAQFVECDDLPLDEQWAQIKAFPLEPSIVVRTRKSLHTYWLMRDAKVAAFRRIQRKLITRFHGDPACVNESRVLRLPGFNHCKQEPLMVECVKFNPELRYTQAQLEACLPCIENPEPAEAPKPLQGGLDRVLDGCDFLRYCRENAPTLPEHDWYAMISNLTVFEGGEATIHRLSAGYPNYSKEETDAKIAHFRASGSGPITCKTIAEKGFRCPKLLDGSCTCAAPAAMSRMPLSADQLRERMNALRPTNRKYEDALAAQRFVERNMSDIEPSGAALFIQHELRPFLHLTAADVKPILARQRELYGNRSNDYPKAESLPEWYEVTQRGGTRFKPGILANRLAREVAAFSATGIFYAYEDGVYQARDESWAANTARQYMIQDTATRRDIADCAWQWQIQVVRQTSEINADPLTLNLRNGLYHVIEDTLTPHTPEHLSTVRIQAAYDPEARCPVFMEALEAMLAEPEIWLLQEIMGYVLVPVTKAQKAFIFVGAANAGKSTILSVLQDVLLGRENVSNIPWQDLGERFNKAELFRRLANIFADLPSKAIDDNGMFKSLTGEDYITAERKNRDPFTFRSTARFLFSCNEMPRNYGDRSEGFYRRLVIIPFTKAIPENKRDPDIRSKLAKERDGILMWALEGLRRLIRNEYRFSETETTKAEIERYRVESNSALQFFQECCALDDTSAASRTLVFERYKQFCQDNCLRPMSQNNFNKDIERAYPTITRDIDRLAKMRIWRGMKLLEE